MLVSGNNNIILLPNCTMLYYVFSGPLSLRAYVPEIKFNNNYVMLNIDVLKRSPIVKHAHFSWLRYGM